MARCIRPLVLVALGLPWWASVGARADELTQNTSLSRVPFGPLFGGDVHVVPFSAQSGTLEAVRIELGIEALGSLRFENQGATPTVARGRCTAEVRLTLAGQPLGTPLAVASREIRDSLGAYDGRIDFAGTSGRSHERVTASASYATTLTAGMPGFGLFAGPATVHLYLGATDTSSAVGGSQVLRQLSNAGAVELAVTYVYTAPTVTAGADAASTCAGTLVEIAALVNDTATGGVLDCSNVSVLVAPAHGSVLWIGCGSGTDCGGCRFRYSPDVGHAGADSFVYRVGLAGNPAVAATATVQIDVLGGPATAPDAVVFAPCAATSVLIPVLANDGVSSGTLAILVAPQHGAAAIEVPEGAAAGPPCVRYTPELDYLGQDEFAYRVVDQDGCASAPTLVAIGVQGGVAAQDDDYPLCAGASPTFSLAVLANDASGGGPFPSDAVTLVTPPNGAAGSVTVGPNGTLDFTPLPAFRGTCGLQYAVRNAAGCTATANVTIHLEDPPTAVTDTYSVPNDHPLHLGVLANDLLATSGELDCASIQIVDFPQHGSIALQGCSGSECADCTVVYSPEAGYTGPDAFRYSVASVAGCRAEADVQLDVDDPVVLPLTGGLPSHASLLVFPEYDSRQAALTLLTVTNTNSDPVDGGVWVEFFYIREPDCFENNRFHYLTPNDTLTVLVSADNPGQERGYAYLYATDGPGSPSQPISFNHLIGNEIVMDGLSSFDYSLNPFMFKAIAPPGDSTNMDGDALRDLDGVEYEEAPGKILIPRFFGQDPSQQGFHGDLIVIPLTGGTRFLTTIDFLIYNDNEQVFSGQRVFPCWSKRPLLQISAAFSQTFLASTNDDAGEILGDPSREAGWFELEGLVANSTLTAFSDPAVLAVYVEGSSSFAVADLPFATGTRRNGDLLSISLGGDTSP